MSSSLFQDRDTSAARQLPGPVDLGGGRCLLLPKIFGFCRGVLSALKRLENVLAEPPGNDIWLLGEIIHNETVNEHFRNRGIRTVPENQLEQIFSLAQPEDCLIIPAFGVEKDLEKRLHAFSRNVVDTTCDCVQLVWDFAGKQGCAGCTVLLHGKPHHPETKATLSRALCGGNAAVIIPNLAHAHRFAAAITNKNLGEYPPELVHQASSFNPHRLAMANQTTMLFQETRTIEAIIATASQSIAGEFFPAQTVCRATQARQDAARALCESGLDLVLVIGGFTSSNTNQLYRLASRYAPTWFIRNANALSPGSIQHFDPKTQQLQQSTDWLPANAHRIGLLAGASCPPGDIGAVIRTLRSFA